MMGLKEHFSGYAKRLSDVLEAYDWGKVEVLYHLLKGAWENNRNVFFCGNGGSAANALHLANDYVYPIAKQGRGIKATALPSNQAVVTCLGNDEGYDEIFSLQLRTLGDKGDLLIVLSGSGNSTNIEKAILKAKEMGITVVGVFGFNGGKCLNLVDHAIHVELDDMQIVEDFQLILGHMMMKVLRERI